MNVAACTRTVHFKQSVKDGEDALVAQLSSPIGWVGTDNDNNVIGTTVLSTTVSLYYGDTQDTLTDLSVTITGDIEDNHVTTNTATGEVLVQLDEGAIFEGGNVYITATSEHGTRSVIYSVVPSVQGSQGDPGTSVNIKGTVDSYNDLPSDAAEGDGYLIDGVLWVKGDTEWIEAGSIQGPQGASAYVHIAWADDASGTNIHKASLNSYSQPYIGVCTNSTQSDSALSVSAYAWTKIAGDDATTFSMTCSPTYLAFDADSEGGALKSDYTVVRVQIAEIVGSTRTQMTAITAANGIALRLTYGGSVRNITNSTVTDGKWAFSTLYNNEYLTKVELLNASTSEVMAADYFPQVKDGDTGQQGNPGNDAVVYRLNPSVTSVIFKRNASDVLTPSSTTLYCGYIKTEGSTTKAYAGTSSSETGAIDGSIYIFARAQLATGAYAGLGWVYQWESQGFGVTLSSSTSYAAIQYILCSAHAMADIFDTGQATGNLIYDKVLDVVTVPIVKEAAKGGTGDQGLTGCIQRTSEWHEGVEYHNDNDLKDAIRYIDTIWEEDSTLTTGYQGYICSQTHTATTDTRPGTGANWQQYWTKVNSMAPISTPFLYAGYSLIKFMQGNQLLMQDEDSNIVAGLQGVSTKNVGEVRYPLWIGGATPDVAPMRVAYDGSLECSNAKVNGYLSSPFTQVASSSATYFVGSRPAEAEAAYFYLWVQMVMEEQGCTYDEAIQLIYENDEYSTGAIIQSLNIATGIDDGGHIILPTDLDYYEGARVIVSSRCYGPTSNNMKAVNMPWMEIEVGSKYATTSGLSEGSTVTSRIFHSTVSDAIFNGLDDPTAGHGVDSGVTSIRVIGGTVELLGVRSKRYTSDIYSEATEECLDWIVVNDLCQGMMYYKDGYQWARQPIWVNE